MKPYYYSLAFAACVLVFPNQSAYSMGIDKPVEYTTEFEKIDEDKDGYLTVAEVDSSYHRFFDKKYGTGSVNVHLGQIDFSKPVEGQKTKIDVNFTKEEFVEFNKERLFQYDADKDNKLSKSEYLQMIKNITKK